MLQHFLRSIILSHNQSTYSRSIQFRTCLGPSGFQNANRVGKKIYITVNMAAIRCEA